MASSEVIDLEAQAPLKESLSDSSPECAVLKSGGQTPEFDLLPGANPDPHVLLQCTTNDAEDIEKLVSDQRPLETAPTLDELWLEKTRTQKTFGVGSPSSPRSPSSPGLRNRRQSPSARGSIDSSSGESGSSHLPDMEKLGYRQRAEELKKLKDERNTFYFDLASDLLELVTKSAAFVKTAFEQQQEERFLIMQGVLLFVAASLLALAITWRMLQLRGLVFLARNGYAKHWNIRSRLVKDSRVDPRLENDQKARILRGLQIRSLQAICGDLPWAVFSVLAVAFGSLKIDFLVLASVASSGCSFGMKLESVKNLAKMYVKFGGAEYTHVYQSLLAEIKVGTGLSGESDAVAATEEAYGKCVGMLGTVPTFMVVTANVNWDHEKGLGKLSELAPGVPFVGGTTCQGVMSGPRSYRQEFVLAIWALYDPEGYYVTEIWEHSSDAEKRQLAAKRAAKTIRNAYPKMQPSFVFMMSAPGPEDQILSGLARGFGSVPVIGGTSADNDITGKWRQWASVPDNPAESFRIQQNGCCLCGVWCSAKVQSQLFTGYQGTAKVGEITKMDGPRHILEIDHRPATQVYNEWTGREFEQLLSDPEDSVVLAESSLYPLGQLCGQDRDGEPIYRVMHPHLLVKKSQSVTLFSDVKVGETVCMMSGTKENIVNRIAGVATYIVRHSGFALPEVRGSLVFFCAGAMMYADDMMDLSAAKLSSALGGTPYIGVHTFGEQGQFPDGENRHGNLMFSAIMFSSKRRMARLLNVDTGEEVREDDPAFQDVLLNGTIL